MGIAIITMALILYFTVTACDNYEKVNAYKQQKRQWLSEDRAYLASRR